MLTEGGKIFLTIWAGQLVSRIGTAMTRFALIVWLYQETGNATTLALLGFASFIPLIVLGPFAGVWIDRFDRRKILLLADMGAGMMTVTLMVLYVTGRLATWQILLASGVAGAFEAFQMPAYLALSSTLLPKSAYGRASGLRSIADFGAQVLAPVLGGLVLSWLGLAGVMAVDVATLLVALLTLIVVRLPKQDHGKEGAEAGALQRFLAEARVGFRYLWRRRGLLGYALVSMVISFLAAITWLSILPAMILARSGNDEMALASVQSAMGIAGLAGGILVSVWGGPQRKVRGIFLSIALSFLLGDIPLAIGRSLAVWTVAGAAGSFFLPILFSSQEALWQAKVAPHVQGRVFAVRNMIVQLLMPAGYLLGGVLADQVMEPAMADGGALAAHFGWLVGTGPGAGMALMFIGSAVSAIILCILAVFSPSLKGVENDLPDYDEVTAVSLTAGD